MVQLGHVRSGHALLQGPPVRHGAVQQHHRGPVTGLIQRLSLPDHLPDRRQPGQRPAAPPGHRVGPGIPQRRVHRRRRREILPGHRRRRRRGRPLLPGPRRGSRGNHPRLPPGHRPGRHHDHDAQGHPAATAARPCCLRGHQALRPLPGRPLPGRPLPGRPLPGRPLPGRPLPALPAPRNRPAHHEPTGFPCSHACKAAETTGEFGLTPASCSAFTAVFGSRTL
jgi:hypothetical protein